MKMSVIIPVFNERGTISDIIKKAVGVVLPVGKELIVVNDGSSDDTGVVLRKLKDEIDFILLEHEKNQGKGAAIKTGLGAAKGDLVLIQDADLEYDPNDYLKLITPFLTGNAKVVYGSRILSKSRRGKLSFYLGGRFLTFAANLLYGLRITDESTCYKVFRADLIKELNLESKGFEFCAEVTAKIGKRKIPICEVPISYNARTKEKGKKIKWIDGFVGLFTLIKYKFIK